MSGEHIVQYAILEYRHDAATGEHLNVGVALFDPEERFFRAKIDTTYGRITKTFPSANGEGYKRYAAHLRNAFEALEERLTSAQHGLIEEQSLDALLAPVIPRDDSAVRFGDVRTAISRNPPAMLDGLFERLVMRYARSPARTGRTDDDVWDTFKRPLLERHILERMTSHTVVTDYEEFVYGHAIKNGRWHCLQPISLDLMQSVTIRKKAREHFAEASIISEVADPPRLHWLVGAPRSEDADVQRAYGDAVGLLRQGATKYGAEVHEEAEAEVLAKIVAELLDEHEDEE